MKTQYQSTSKKPVPVPLCPLQAPHGLSCDLTHVHISYVLWHKVTLRNNIYTHVDPESIINIALEDKSTYTGALPPRAPPNVPHPTPVKLTRKSWIRFSIGAICLPRGTLEM